MSNSTYKINATGAGAIAATMTVPVSKTYRLVSVSLHNSAAPTTSENLTITLDANAGAAYDTLLYTIDLAAAAVTDLMWSPDEEKFLEGGDAIDVAYANTDVVTWGVQITVKEV